MIRIGHVRGLCALLLVVVGTACPADTTSPGKGGRNDEPNPCGNGKNNGWTNNQLTLEMSKPPCPFEIKTAGATVTFAGRITAPSTKITYLSPGGAVSSYVTAFVMKRSDASQIAFDGFNTFQQSPSDPNIFFSEISMDGNPGYYVEASNPTKMLDSLHAQAQFMASGYAESWKFLAGNINANAPIIIGGNAIATGQIGTWRSYPEWDTTAYNYKWLVDGQEVAGAIGAAYSTSFTTGTHSVSNVTIRADNTRDSLTVFVKAYNGSISGPSNVRPFVTCIWFADASGGTAPYSYSWTAVGGSGTGQWFDYFNSVASGGSFTVQLSVTDGTGATITIDKNVNVSSNAPVCSN